MKNTIIYLIGNAGVGKLTIAKELTSLFPHIKLMDNHLSGNLVWSVSGDTRHPLHLHYLGKARNLLFEIIQELGDKEDSYILTNVLYRGENDWYEPVREMAEARGAVFLPVVITCDPDEHRKRIVSHERKAKLKTTNPENVNHANEIGIVEFDHPNKLEIDNTHLSAKQTAEMIISAVQKLQEKGSAP